MNGNTLPAPLTADGGGAHVPSSLRNRPLVVPPGVGTAPLADVVKSVIPRVSAPRVPVAVTGAVAVTVVAALALAARSVVRLVIWLCANVTGSVFPAACVAACVPGAPGACQPVT